MTRDGLLWWFTEILHCKALSEGNELRCGGQLFCHIHLPCCFQANLSSLCDDVLDLMTNACELGMQVGSYAVQDVEEYKNFCDRSKDQRPQPDQVVKVILF